jgi:hypothetical protein
MNETEQWQTASYAYFAVTMTTKKYPCQPTNIYGQFVFESIGPNGKIKKVVQYDYMYKLEEDTPLFNLSFGDYNETDQTYKDNIISNNEDKNIVLATVAHTVLDFSKPYNKIAIHAEGRTPSRTRLYQIGINAHKAEIEEQFHVLGSKNGYWYLFEPGINYEAFLIIKK